MLFSGILLLSAENSSAPSYTLYVGNSRGDDISMIDMTSLKVSGVIKAAERVHGVCVQADGRRIFATAETDHTLRIIDTATQKTIGTVQLAGRPNQCAATPDGKYVAVPSRDGDSVDIVDVAQQQIVKVLPIKEPHNALNTGSNRYIYVSSMGAHEVDVIDLEKMELSAHIPAGGRPALCGFVRRENDVRRRGRSARICDRRYTREESGGESRDTGPARNST